MADNKIPLAPLDGNVKLVPQQDRVSAKGDINAKPAPAFIHEGQ